MGQRAIGKMMHYVWVVITFLLVIVTIIASYASNFKPESSFLMPFLGLGYPVLIIANFVVMLLWLIRFRIWCLVPLIAIGLGYSPLKALFKPSFFNKESTEGNFRIASFNVSAFNYPTTNEDAKDLARFMEEEKVDILCFQEFAGSNTINDSMLLAPFKHWPYRFIPQGNEKDFNRPVIFSRHPLSNTTFVKFKNTKNCAIYCDIQINSKMYRLFNNHLQTTELTQIKEKKNSTRSIEREEYYFRKRMQAMYEGFCIRGEQADEINALVKESPYPVLLCGDFNDGPFSYTYRTMLGDLKDGFVANGSGNAASYRYAKRLFRIDYIFCSKELETTRYFKSEFGESDHYPVLMELAL